MVRFDLGEDILTRAICPKTTRVLSLVRVVPSLRLLSLLGLSYVARESHTLLLKLLLLLVRAHLSFGWAENVSTRIQARRDHGVNKNFYRSQI